MKRMKYNITYGEDDEPTSVTVYWRGKVFVAQEGHPNFTLVVDALEQKRPAGEVIDLFDVKGALARGFSLARKVVQAITDQTISRVQLRDEGMTVTEARKEPAEPEPRSNKRYEWMTDAELREVEASDNPREVETRILAERAAADVSEATEATKKIAPPPPRVVAGEADTPENLDDLNQRQLQALHKELGLGSGVGKSNAWLRGRIMEARDPGGIPDDDGLDALKQRELQTLAKRLGVGSGVGKTNAWLKDRIRERRAQHLTDVAGKVEIHSDGRLFFDGEEMNGALADAIIAYHRQGNKDFTPLVRFMAKLQENPNPHSREHLYQWMAHLSFAIHEDGDLIAYKGVRKNGDSFVSDHSWGTATVNGVKHERKPIPNPIGGVVSMPREEVTFDPKVGCSTGLHVGTVGFAANYGNAMIEVKIHPADVVSTPTENTWQKLRVCKYTVVRGCSREEARELNKARLTAV